MESIYKVVTEPGEHHFPQRAFGTGSSELQQLADWLRPEGVREVVRESTAQYWRPVWQKLEPQCQLHLAQAHSNRAPKGRKRDFEDAQRLVRRFVAGELILSFAPDEQQRLWRIMTRTRQPLTRHRVRWRNQLEGFLEESRLKLSSPLSDLFGSSGIRRREALAKGATDPAAIAALADPSVRASQAQLADALTVASPLIPQRRKILKLFLERLQLIDSQREALAKSVAECLREHERAVTRLAETPGLGADSAQQIVAEIGPRATSFESPERLASWVGCCPGRAESASVSRSDRSPKGNRQMRRLLNQAANAAVKAKGSVFADTYRRLVPRLGHAKAIWAVAHKLCRIIWKILHDGATYRERGRGPDPKAIHRRVSKMVRHLRELGYSVQLDPIA